MAAQPEQLPLDSRRKRPSSVRTEQEPDGTPGNATVLRTPERDQRHHLHERKRLRQGRRHEASEHQLPGQVLRRDQHGAHRGPGRRARVRALARRFHREPESRAAQRWRQLYRRLRIIRVSLGTPLRVRRRAPILSGMSPRKDAQYFSRCQETSAKSNRKRPNTLRRLRSHHR